MKNFEDIQPRKLPLSLPVTQQSGKVSGIKKNIVNRLDRSQEIKSAALAWLLSFSSGISFVEAEKQLAKLEYDDAKALHQLDISKGKRTVRLFPRVKPPVLGIGIIDTLAEHHSIAIESNTGRKAIEDFLETLPEAGVYILDVNELVLTFIDYQHRGNAPQIIEQSTRASILVVLGLEKPISLDYHIRDTLYQLAATRKKNPDKYTLSTWNYTHQYYIPDYGNQFIHFSI